jgi:hypothetical protein
MNMEKITLEFNAQQLEILNMSLLEIPYKLSAPIINNINSQIKNQIEKNQTTQENNNTFLDSVN